MKKFFALVLFCAATLSANPFIALLSGSSESFNPSSYGTVLLDLSAEDASTLYTDSAATTLVNPTQNEPVGAWMDRVTGTVKAVEVTLSARPVYRPYGVNGMPSIHFEPAALNALQVSSLGLPTFATYVVVARAQPSNPFFLEHSADSVFNSGMFFRGDENAAWLMNRGGSYHLVVGETDWAGSDLMQGIFTYGAGGGAYYKNGVTQANTSPTGTARTQSTATTTFNIGARDGGTALYMRGDFLRILVYDGELSSGNRTNLEAALQAKYLSAATSSNSIVFDGDSLTWGVGWGPDPGHDYPSHVTLALGPSWRWDNFGVPGQTLAQMESDAATQIDPLVSRGSGENILVVFGGINDFVTQNQATVQSRMNTYLDARRTAGWTKIVGVTLLPHDDMVPNFTEAERQTFRAYMVGLVGTKLDAVVEVDDDPDIGADNANNSATYYSDGIHLNNAGTPKLGVLVKAVIDLLLISLNFRSLR